MKTARHWFTLAVTVAVLLCPPGLSIAQRRKAPRTQTRHTKLADSFIFGINCPWFEGEFDHDLGPNPAHPDWGCWYKPEKVTDYFQDIHSIGFSVVRVWLMEGAEGLTIGDDGIITGLDDTFLQNLDDMVRRAHDENLRLYLCLTTSWKWRDGKYPSPVKNKKQQDAYLDKAVKPIAERLKGNDTIFAFDIFNEIESEVVDTSIKVSRVTIAQARTFLRRNVTTIKKTDPNRLVSAGSGWNGWKSIQDGHYKNLGLDFYDFHLYRDDGFLPNVQELNVDRPVVVGECGVNNSRDANEKEVSDDLQSKCDCAFLRNALAKGYAGCFIWDYSPKGHVHNIVRENGHRPVCDAIRDIIQGSAK